MKKKIGKGVLKFFVFLEVAALFFALGLYLLSSPDTLKYALDRATQKLDFHYSSISGNLLKTMTIHNLRYKDKVLAQEAEIDWNLRALVRGDIEVEWLSLKRVNLKNIQTMIEESQKNSTTQTPKSSALPNITISHLDVTTLPYHSKYIDIQYLSLNIFEVSTNKAQIRIKEFDLDTQTNYGTLTTDGYIKDAILNLNSLSLHNLNIENIQKTLSTLENDTNNSREFSLLKGFRANIFDITFHPYSYEDFHFKTLRLKGKNLNTLFYPIQIDTQSISLESDNNIAKITLDGSIASNTFQGKSSINLVEKYFQKFTKIIDFQSLNPINLTMSVDEKQIQSDISLRCKQVFAQEYKDYFTAINTLHSQVSYDFESQSLQALTDANISTKYADSLILKDTLTYDNSLHYGGTIDISSLNHFPKYSLPLFQNGVIIYRGDKKDLVANLHTDKLHLLYEMYDFNRADFTLKSKPLEIVKYFPKIPTFIHPLTATLDAKMSMDFNNQAPLKIPTIINSNGINFKGTTQINGGLVNFQSVATLGKESFLKDIDKNLKISNLFPMDMSLTYHDNDLSIILDKDGTFHNDFGYDLNLSTIENTLKIASEKITVQGDDNRLDIHTHVNSLKTFQEKLQAFYNFNKEPLDGEIDIKGRLKNYSDFKGDILSKWLVYEYTPYHFAFAEKIKLAFSYKNHILSVPTYTFQTYIDEDRRFFANKTSSVLFQKDTLHLQNLWVNDALNTQGEYDLKSKKGVFHSHAKGYHYVGKEGDILFDTDIETLLAKDSTHIEGGIIIKKGLITYEHRNNHDIQDPDIIIIQKEQERLRKAAEKKNNLSIDISVISKEALVYKTPKIDVLVTPDIKIWKDTQRDIEMLGRVVINQGTYNERDKLFTILPGEILFAGEILNPYLNIKARHKNDPYIIDIDIAGSLDSPIINFSSNPFLSQSDILSMLLFSATTESLFEGSSSSSNQALSVLGNTFAKEIVKNFGLTLDKLVLSTNEEGGLGIEIGKKISKKITVIYINDIVQSIKVRYQHSNNFETDLMLSPESSGIDFFYKSEH